MAATEDRRETDSEIEIKPVYTEEDVQGLELEPPGEYPFTRGPYKDMYRGRPWTIRQYAGFGSAVETNQRFRYLLERGQTGLSVAFDLPTQLGYDSDDPRAVGEVGRTGVAIDSIADMELLFDGIPLGEVSTSMTINAPAALLLLLYELVAEQQGVSGAELRGTVQNDVLKEYCARGNYIFPPKPTMRITTDLFAYCHEQLPRFNTISISGYHIREAGRRPSRSSPSRSRTGSRTPRRRSRPASHRTSSASGSRSSSTRTTTSSRRSRSSGRRAGCGRGSCATASAPRIRGRSPFASTPRPAAPR